MNHIIKCTITQSCTACFGHWGLSNRSLAWSETPWWNTDLFQLLNTGWLPMSIAFAISTCEYYPELTNWNEKKIFGR